MQNLATQMAPPFVLVAHYFLAATIFFAFSALTLPFFWTHLDSFFVSTTIASFSHLFLLGFVMMTIFGAMYQLVPVILEIPLFSKDFAYVQFYLFVIGILLMVFAFALEGSYMLLLPYGALICYISMIIFIINILLTYKNLKKWSIVAKFIFVSNIFLFIGITIGFLIAIHLSYGVFEFDPMPMIKMHIVATVVGYVTMTIMGVAMVLVPMFGLSHGFDDKPIKIAFYLITIGVILYLASVFDMEFINIFSILLISISILFFAYQMIVIYRNRARKIVDYWSLNMVASFWLLISVIIMAFLIVFVDFEALKLAIGFALFFGFFLFIVVGHIYKILPFLVWFQRYSPLVGKQKVPMLHEMVLTKLANMQFWTSLAGFVVALCGILSGFAPLFLAGSIAMAVGAFMVIYNVFYTLNYKK